MFFFRDQDLLSRKESLPKLVVEMVRCLLTGVQCPGVDENTLFSYVDRILRSPSLRNISNMIPKPVNPISNYIREFLAEGKQ